MGCQPSLAMSNVENQMLIKGKGLIEFQNGDVYDGEWAGKKVFQGHGILNKYNKFTYEGEFEKGQMQGYGIIQYYTGEIYKGGFLNDLYHGKGTKILPNGPIFQIEHLQGIAQGRLRVHTDICDAFLDLDNLVNLNEISSSRYQSYCSKDQISSQHVFHEYIYFGATLNSQRHGQGKLMFKDSNYLGGFLENQKHGYGIYASNAFIHKGQYRMGHVSGNGLRKSIESQILGLFQSTGVIGDATTIEKQQIVKVTGFVDPANKIRSILLITDQGISKVYQREQYKQLVIKQ